MKYLREISIAVIAVVFGSAVSLQAQPSGSKAASHVPTAAKSTAVPTAPSGLAASVAVGTAIQDRVLLGQATEFNASIGRIYCWSKITGKGTPATIKHVWYADGKILAEVPLKVERTPWRTWSDTTVRPGTWKVDVVEAGSGAVLASAAFTVKR